MEERRRAIVELVNKMGSVSIAQLKEAFPEVSEMTIRNDIKALDRRTAAKDFKQYVGNYADAYVILTVANDSRTTFFFDVYKAGTNELLYTYQIQANRSEGDTVATYTNMAEQFYKHFERSAVEQQKETSKKK